MFAAWCALAAEFEEDPHAMVASRVAQMRGLASSFGLEPSARTRLTTGGGEVEVDPAEAFFG